MQNVLLAFPYEVTVKSLAESLSSAFERIEFSIEFPDKAVLLNDDDHVFLYQYYDIKENYEQWFGEDQHDLVMSMECFIELQYRKLQTVKDILRTLSKKYEQIVIQFDDFSLNGLDFLDKIDCEPNWDWR